jgi:hypothetical protein
MTRHIVVCILLSTTAAFAAEDARKIVSNSQDAQRVEATTLSKMIIVDGKGAQRERKVEAKAKKFEDVWKTYLKFSFPPDIAGTQFLVLENKGVAEDDLFLYQPINKRTRRITSAQRSGRFVGTDFFYEDMDIRDVDEDDHKLLRTEKLKLSAGKQEETIDAFVMESTPKPDSPSAYSKVVSWIDRANYYPRQVEMYQGDKLVKRFRVYAVKKDGKNLIPMLSQMEDLVGNSRTILSNESYSLDREGISDQIFSESYMLAGG